MNIERACQLTDINWGTLPELRVRLEGLGISVRNVSATLYRTPDSVTYDSFEATTQDVQTKGPPKRYSLCVFGTCEKKDFTMFLNRDKNIRGKEFMSLTLYGITDPGVVDSVTQFLGLKPREPQTLPPQSPRTAFIAHRFDNAGLRCASQLARFLELLGFSVVTGRDYAPGSVAAKVRGRIEQQAVLFVLLTAGSDSTWLVQESVLGQVKGKPVVILKEESADFKSGLLGDHEYITFALPYIETTFVPILEGLRELGYSTTGGSEV